MAPVVGFPPEYQLPLSSAIGKVNIVAVFLCSVFLMSQVMVNTTTPPVTVVYSDVSLICMPVTMAPTAVGLAALGQYDVYTTLDLAALCQHDVVLPPPLFPRDTLRGSVGLATVLQLQHP